MLRNEETAPRSNRPTNTKRETIAMLNQALQHALVARSHTAVTPVRAEIALEPKKATEVVVVVVVRTHVFDVCVCPDTPTRCT